MKLAVPTALVLLAATALAAAAAGRDAAGPTPARCGGELWRMKTLSDLGSKAVQLESTTTEIAAIGKRPYPRPVPRLRRTAFQRHAWEVVAQITKYRFETEGIRLELFDHESYLNAVIPTPDCLSKTSRARDDMTSTFNLFTAECGHRTTTDWQSLGAIVYVRGVGFWSQRRSQGAARNGAELHPVTGLRIVAGC